MNPIIAFLTATIPHMEILKVDRTLGDKWLIVLTKDRPSGLYGAWVWAGDDRLEHGRTYSVRKKAEEHFAHLLATANQLSIPPDEPSAPTLGCPIVGADFTEQAYDRDEQLFGDLGIDVPSWIDQEITTATVAAIQEGGCSSGAYMPAVTYYTALQTMNDHGDAVLSYLESAVGDWRGYLSLGDSWDGMAVAFVSCAVECWAGAVEYEIEMAWESMAEGAE